VRVELVEPAGWTAFNTESNTAYCDGGQNGILVCSLNEAASDQLIGVNHIGASCL